MKFVHCLRREGGVELGHFTTDAPLAIGDILYFQGELLEVVDGNSVTVTVKHSGVATLLTPHKTRKRFKL